MGSPGFLWFSWVFLGSPGFSWFSQVPAWFSWFFQVPAWFSCLVLLMLFNPDCPSQLKLWYDKVGHQLIVTVLGAKELPVRDDGRPRNPYVKIYFLPDRRYPGPSPECCLSWSFRF